MVLLLRVKLSWLTCWRALKVLIWAVVIREAMTSVAKISKSAMGTVGVGGVPPLSRHWNRRKHPRHKRGGAQARK